MPFVPVEEAPRGRFVPVDEPPAGADLIPGAAPGQQAPAAEPRQVGFLESAGRTAGAAAIPVARSVGLAGGALAGILSPALQEKVFRKMDQVVGGMRRMYEPKPDEEFSTAGRLAGGIASAPIEMAGGMGLQHGVERAAQVVERGGTMGQAAKAGAVSGGVGLTMNALPVKAGGVVGSVLKSKLGTVASGALTGGAIAGASGSAARRAENAALPEGEQFADLRQDEAVSAEEVGLGAAMGAVPGAAGAAKNLKRRDAVLKPVAAAAAKTLDVNPQKLALAKDAIDLGFDVMPHQISDRGALMEVAGEAAEQIPFSKSAVKKNERLLTRKLIEQINPDEPSKQLTPGVMRRAQETNGQTIGRNMAEIAVPLDVLAPHLDRVREGLNPATDSTDAVVHRYLGQIGKLADENGGVVPGKALRELDTEIGAEMRRMGFDRSDARVRLDDLQDAIRDTAEAQMSPEKAKQTQDARVRYAKAMSLVPVADDIARTGYIKPATFAQLATSTKFGKYLTAFDKGGEWGKLANAARVIEPGEARGRLWAGGTTAVGIGGVAVNPGTAAAAATAAGVALAGANAYNRNGPALVRRLVRDADAKRARLGEVSTDMPPEAPPPEPGTTPGAGGPQDNRPGPGGSKVLPAPEADLMPSAQLEAPAGRTAEGLAPKDLLPAVGDDQPPVRIIRGAGADRARRAEPAARAVDAEDPGALPQEEAPRKRFVPGPAERTPSAEEVATRRQGIVSVDREPLAEGARRERVPEQIPAVPGRPDMPEVMVAGDLGDAAKQGRAPGEVGRDAATGAAMQSDDAALARQNELQSRYGAAGGKMEPSVDQVPVGEATEIVPETVKPAPGPKAKELDADLDPRLARIEELRSRTDSKAVHAALDKRAADVKKQIKAEAAAAKREADVAELEAAANATDDVEMRQHLLAEANRLRVEKPAAGDVKEGQPPLPKPEATGKIPVGKAKEVDAPLPEPEAPEPLPVGEATELQPEVVESVPAANEPPTQALVPEATTVENAAPETKKVKRMIEPKTETFEELSARMKATPTAERSAEDMGRYWDMHRERGLAEETKAAAEREAAKTARAKETKGMTLAQIKAHDYLQQEVVHDGKPMARAAWVEKQLEAGAEPSVELVDKVKPMSRMAHFRASNAEQRAHEAKVKAGGKVPEYFLGDFKVSKTEHEYAVRKRGEALRAGVDQNVVDEAVRKSAEKKPAADAPTEPPKRMIEPKTEAPKRRS